MKKWIVIIIALTTIIAMANAAELVPIIKKAEGGFSNHPLDKGGATNSGITIGTYRHYCKLKGKKTPTVTDLKRMSDDEWLDVFKTLFWNPFRADEIMSQSIANICVDFGWASGTVTAIKHIQDVLGVKRDGIVGSVTLNAINGWPNQEELFNLIKNKRKWHFDRIVAKNPSQKVFIRGWYARLALFKFEE